jgi:Ser/Thr protein kinase RdoA (MazF antagonist)
MSSHSPPALPPAGAVRRATAVPDDRCRELAAFLADRYGLDGVTTMRTMGSEADETLVLERDGGPFAVLKLLTPAGVASAQVQVAMLDHVAGRLRAAVPTVHRTVAGTALEPVVTAGRQASALVTTFCPGEALEDLVPSAALVRDVARTLGELQAALADLPAPLPTRHPWSLDSIADLGPLVATHLSERHRACATAVLGRYAEFRDTVRPALPAQPVHADFNLSNVLAHGDVVTGVIDFGDAVHVPRVYDVAIALAYLTMQQPPRRAALTSEFLGAYRPLEPAEHAALPLLVTIRVLLVLLLGREAATRGPDRAAYALRYDEPAATLLDALITDGVA